MTEDLSQSSDTALVVAVGRWRSDALAELYRRHGGAIYGLARRVLVDVSTAEEIVQEVFLRLWDNPSRYDPERGTLRSFLLADCHGRAVDRLRSDVSRRKREERQQRTQAESGYDLEHEVWDLVVADRVRDALEELPPGQRDAIQLAYFGGKTYREVAAALGEPEGTVKTRIRMGLKALRVGLSEAGVGEQS